MGVNDSGEFSNGHNQPVMGGLASVGGMGAISLFGGNGNVLTFSGR